MSSQKPKILYFTKYSRNAGSSRLRSFQYFPYLEKAGFEVQVSPLFSEQYLVNLYAGKSTLKDAVKGYAARFFQLIQLRQFDHIVLEKELFPYLPEWAERMLSFFNVKYIVDYDDAIFHNYDQSTNSFIKNILSNKIDTVMKLSQVVVAGNSYLADRANRAGARRIEIIPTVIDLERYPPLVFTPKQPLVLGWIGTKSTFEKHVLPIMPWLQKAVVENGIEVHIVGANSKENFGENIKFFPWREATEVAMIHQFDLGMMPLEDTLWEKGKCSYKLIQYMACGKPVIASPVGMNKEVVNEGKNGFTAVTEKDWLAAIKTLVTDAEKRQSFGEAGRRLVEEKFALQVTAKKWIEIFKGVPIKS